MPRNRTVAMNQGYREFRVQALSLDDTQSIRFRDGVAPTGLSIAVPA